jgi:hypothetical protein
VSVSAPRNFETEGSRSGAMSLIALKGEVDRDAEPRLREVCQSHGRRFFLIRARPHIDRLLTLSGVNGPFDIIGDLDHLEDGSLTVER